MCIRDRVDTAAIRKKNKVSEDLEYYSVIRCIRSIENSDVCILMLDATRGIEGQDLNCLLYTSSVVRFGWLHRI